MELPPKFSDFGYFVEKLPLKQVREVNFHCRKSMIFDIIESLEEITQQIAFNSVFSFIGYYEPFRSIFFG